MHANEISTENCEIVQTSTYARANAAVEIVSVDVHNDAFYRMLAANADDEDALDVFSPGCTLLSLN